MHKAVMTLALMAGGYVACQTTPTEAPRSPLPQPSMSAATSVSVTVATASPEVTVQPVPRAVRPHHKIACGDQNCTYPAEVCCNSQTYDHLTRELGEDNWSCAAVTDPTLLNKDMGVYYACEGEFEAYDHANAQLTALACDDSNDCDHGRCMARSDSAWSVAQCIDERDNGGVGCQYGDNGVNYAACPMAMGDREACRPGTCATKGTECRKGFACGFYGTLCERMAVCDAKPPRCGTAACSSEEPLCCVTDGKPGCAASCNWHAMNPTPEKGSWACTSAAGCGPEMACCLSLSFGIPGSFCAYGCDTQALSVACDDDDDCRGYSGLQRCGSTRKSRFGIRTCE